MSSEALDALYGALAEAIGRAGPERTPLLLATLALDLLAHHDDPVAAAAAIARAERLANLGDGATMALDGGASEERRQPDDRSAGGRGVHGA